MKLCGKIIPKVNEHKALRTLRFLNIQLDKKNLALFAVKIILKVKQPETKKT